MAFTEEQLKEIEDLFEKYYRRKYPTFEVTGGGPTRKHDDVEYACTTDGKVCCISIKEVLESYHHRDLLR